MWNYHCSLCGEECNEKKDYWCGDCSEIRKQICIHTPKVVADILKDILVRNPTQISNRVQHQIKTRSQYK